MQKKTIKSVVPRNDDVIVKVTEYESPSGTIGLNPKTKEDQENYVGGKLYEIISVSPKIKDLKKGDVVMINSMFFDKQTAAQMRIKLENMDIFIVPSSDIMLKVEE